MASTASAGPTLMTWAGTNRTNTAHWQRLRRLILERDRRQCQWPTDANSTCAKPAHEVDHKLRPALGGTDHPDNLWALCPTHHQAKTHAEATDARPRLARPREKHPGLITPAPHGRHPSPR